MTHIMDTLFIKAGLDAAELQSVKTRSLLYFGMIGMSVVGVIFFGLTLGSLIF